MSVSERLTDDRLKTCPTHQLLQLERLFGNHFVLQLQAHPPRAEFIVERFPDGVAQVEVPIVRANVYFAFERQSHLALCIADTRVVDTIVQLLVFRSLDVDDKSELDVDFRPHIRGNLNVLRKLFGVRVPRRVDTIRPDSNFRFSFRHYRVYIRLGNWYLR